MTAFDIIFCIALGVAMVIYPFYPKAGDRTLAVLWGLSLGVALMFDIAAAISWTDTSTVKLKVVAVLATLFAAGYDWYLEKFTAQFRQPVLTTNN